MAKCDICHKEAVVADYTLILEGQKVILKVCESCAKQEQAVLASEVGSEAIKWLVQQVIKELGQAVDNVLIDKPTKPVDEHCPQCGITFEEITKTSKLGCPNDYDFFGERLKPVIKIIQHMASQHTGKRPSRIPAEQQVKVLEQQLGNAVDKELYEEAAVLRDKINNLKGKV